MPCRRGSGRTHDRREIADAGPGAGHASAPTCSCRWPSRTASRRRRVSSPSTGSSTVESTWRSGSVTVPPRRARPAWRGADADAAAQRVPDRRRLRQPALRLRRRSCASPSSDSTQQAGSCSTCGRRGAASASTPSSTPTCSRTHGLDTYEANVALGYGEDERDYTVAAQMLGALGVSRVALLSNNPDKAEQLRRLGRHGGRAGAHGRAPVRRQRPLPRHEGGARRAHPRPLCRGSVGPGLRVGGTPTARVLVLAC